MIVWVVYDITDNKTRNRVAKICKKYGLYRVQKSVFLGTINETEKKIMSVEITDLIDEEVDSVYIFPMSKSELKATVLLGQAFDKKLITDEVKALFL